MWCCINEHNHDFRGFKEIALIGNRISAVNNKRYLRLAEVLAFIIQDPAERDTSRDVVTELHVEAG